MKFRAVLLLAALAACGGDDPFAPLADPGDVPDVAPSTTAPLGSSGFVLPTVPGSTTTTSLALGPGPARLRGRVSGPDGPVAGATVLLERLVGDAVAARAVTAGPDGGWDVGDVLGGRWRVRAWRPPDLAVGRSEVLFVEAGAPVEVDLALDRLGGNRADVAVAPSVPEEDVPVNVRVRVASRVVDADGVLRDRPQPGIPVTLTGSGAWSLGGSNPATTGADGSVVFTITCRSAGAPALVLSVTGVTDVPPLPGCAASAPGDTATTSTTEG